MNIAISGCTGFIGSELISFFADKNINVIKIFRSDFNSAFEKLVTKINDCDAVINLSGATINKRWTNKYKNEIYESRINTTKILVKAICACKEKPKVFINASAIGIYDDINIHTESSKNFAENFISKVVNDWEKEASFVNDCNVNYYILRLGIVLSKNGGIIKKLMPFFKYGLGAKIGNGKQYFSYIYISDLINIIELAMFQKITPGVINVVVPKYITNSEFTQKLAIALNKKAFFTVPKFILKIIYGEGAEVLTSGQAVIPQKLIDYGYKFEKTNISDILK